MVQWNIRIAVAQLVSLRLPLLLLLLPVKRLVYSDLYLHSHARSASHTEIRVRLRTMLSETKDLGNELRLHIRRGPTCFCCCYFAFVFADRCVKIQQLFRWALAKNAIAHNVAGRQTLRRRDVNENENERR